MILQILVEQSSAIGHDGVVHSISEVLPPFKGTGAGRAWEGFLDRTCKFLHFLLVMRLAGVDARPALLFRAVRFLCSQLDLATYQGVISIIVSTLIAACDVDAGRTVASGEDQDKVGMFYYIVLSVH